MTFFSPSPMYAWESDGVRVCVWLTKAEFHRRSALTLPSPGVPGEGISNYLKMPLMADKHP